jgi:hypothetical protein
VNALSRLEDFLQGLMERPAWLLARRQLHPVELAAALVRALEDQSLPIVERTVAPDGYVIRLHPDDYSQVASVRPTLEREFADYLTSVAGERGMVLRAPVEVMIAESRAVRAGAFEVTARISDPLPAGVTLAQRIAPDGPDVTEVVTRRIRTPAEPLNARLEILDDQGGVVRYVPIGGAGLVIGRRSSSGLTLADAEVSRVHARIERTPEGFALHDQQSTNGTRLNGRRIRVPQRLRDGDVIELGRTRLCFRGGG